MSDRYNARAFGVRSANEKTGNPQSGNHVSPNRTPTDPHLFAKDSMMKRHTLGTVLAAVVGLSGLWALAEEKEIPLDKVPPKVLEAVKAKYPKAKIEEAEAEEEDGKTVYEFELEEEDDKGEREWSATFSADGKFIESEEEVKLADVPKATLEALQKKYPLIKKPSVEKVTQGEGAAAKVFYELRFKIEAKIDATGKVISEEEVVKESKSD